MKFSEQWIRKWVNPDLSTKQLAEQLTMLGLEVDGIEPATTDFSQVCVGQVLSVSPHPQADRLRLCQVDVGEAESLSIVCGAANVAMGVRVPVAKVGAVLPDGLTIKKAKLRGVESFGMLCSSAELGLAEHAEGLLLLPDDAPIGEDIRVYLQLDDAIIEVDFTPNRGDCLSVAGIAREIAAINEVPLQLPNTQPVEPQITDVLSIQVDAPKDCPGYLGRVIKNIDPSVPTPLWMQERLRRAGLRCLGPMVDVTNYVLLEWGQPMHAFDLAKLDGGIVVRRAKANENVTLLDESTHGLDESVLVIADQSKVLAFAGVMGGLDSAVSDTTTAILLECAFFTPDSLRGSGRRFGLQTDASYRFERGVDFQLQTRAMEYATRLLLDIVGGVAGPINAVVANDDLPRREKIVLRLARVNRLLGITLAAATIQAILTRLGMTVEVMGESPSVAQWRVIPPSYRYDISIEADLIEEIGRFYGYNNLPLHLPVAPMQMVAEHKESQVSLTRIKNLLTSREYYEAITYSFVDPKTQTLLDPDRPARVLSHPISMEMSVMRTTLWSSLLKTLAYNQHRQQPRIRLFETGMCFYQNDNTLIQEKSIAGVVAGPRLPTQWGIESIASDFFDVKSDIEAIVNLTGCSNEFEFVKQTHPALHPGQTAAIRRQGAQVGWLGVLHPCVQQTLDLTGVIIVFELNYAALNQGVIARFSSISKYPSIQRDLALVVDHDLSAQALCDHVMKAADSRIKQLDIFDVYRGQGIPDGKKSFALALTIQDDKQTLKDDQIEKLLSTILSAVQASCGATLRE